MQVVRYAKAGQQLIEQLLTYKIIQQIPTPCVPVVASPGLKSKEMVVWRTAAPALSNRANLAWVANPTNASTPVTTYTGTLINWNFPDWEKLTSWKQSVTPSALWVLIIKGYKIALTRDVVLYRVHLLRYFITYWTEQCKTIHSCQWWLH